MTGVAVLENVTDSCYAPCVSCGDECDLPLLLVSSLAKSLHAYWREWAELDDIEQEIWVAYLSDAGRLWHLIHGSADDMGLARVILWRAGSRFCRKEQAARLHVPDDYGYRYSKRVLRALLPGVFGGDVASEGSVTFEPSRRGSGSTGSGSEVDTMWIDVRAALQKIPTEDRQALFEVYGDGSQQAGTRHAKYGTAQSALRRLQKELGGLDE